MGENHYLFIKILYKEIEKKSRNKNFNKMSKILSTILVLGLIGSVLCCKDFNDCPNLGGIDHCIKGVCIKVDLTCLTDIDCPQDKGIHYTCNCNNVCVWANDRPWLFEKTRIITAQSNKTKLFKFISNSKNLFNKI